MTDENDRQTDTEPVVQTRYSSGESVSEVVVRALAVAEGVEPSELDLLYDFIDPEALDTLLGDPVISDEPPTIVEFSVLDFRSSSAVTVRSQFWASWTGSKGRIHRPGTRRVER
ncbi:HalOD1 output domain-containing protein [Natrialbaceae archaeon A-CW3]